MDPTSPLPPPPTTAEPTTETTAIAEATTETTAIATTTATAVPTAETTNGNSENENNNGTSDEVSTPSNPLSPPLPDDETTTTTTSSLAVLPKRRRKRKHYHGTISMVLRPHSSSRSSPSFLDTLSFSLPRRRRRTIPDLPKDPPSLDVDALIAISVGFPIDSLTEEEIEAAVIPTLGGGGSADQSNYISVRNQILAKWRSDVSSLVTRDQVVELTKPEHRYLVDPAFEFLVNYGYINFGLAPEIVKGKVKGMGGCDLVGVGGVN